MSQSALFNQEINLNGKLPEQITTFWQQGLFNSFLGVDEVSIHYAQFIQQEAEQPIIVIVPGRCESYLKYQELSFDLYQQGYSIFIIDHRGQGLSGRLLTNLNKGYVVRFQDYVEDLRYFIENIVTPHCSDKPYLLAHSMGAAIATRFMQGSSNAIKAAVISSPMLGFNTGLLPKAIPEMMIVAKLALNSLISKNPWYFFAQKDYSAVSFDNNRLTHSVQRYQIFIDLYKNNKTIQLGGVTSYWLSQVIAAQKQIFAQLDQLKTPILLLQAGSDIVVCQQAQDDFCQQLHALQPQSCPKGIPSRLDGALHELFFEVDDYRNSALNQSLAWFKQHK